MVSTHQSYDAVIIGGSFAGLSAAMTLGRSLRRTLVIDSGRPCNASAPQSHNLITLDGTPPGEILERARRQVLAYPSVELLADKVVVLDGTNQAFEVQTEGGLTVRSRKLVFATGVRDLMPAIEGFADCWGISAIHCPYCHGYEVRGQATGVLVNGEMALHYARLIRNWTDQVTVFTNGPAQFEPGELKEMGIEVVESEVLRLDHRDGHLQNLECAGGESYTISALYHKPEFEQHSELPAGMGCALTEAGLLQVNMMQETSVTGIFAAGDCTHPMRTVSLAIGAGTMAGAGLNHALIADAHAPAQG